MLGFDLAVSLFFLFGPFQGHQLFFGEDQAMLTAGSSYSPFIPTSNVAQASSPVIFMILSNIHLVAAMSAELVHDGFFYSSL